MTEARARDGISLARPVDQQTKRLKGSPNPRGREEIIGMYERAAFNKGVGSLPLIRILPRKQPPLAALNCPFDVHARKVFAKRRVRHINFHRYESVYAPCTHCSYLRHAVWPYAMRGEPLHFVRVRSLRYLWKWRWEERLTKVARRSERGESSLLVFVVGHDRIFRSPLLAPFSLNRGWVTLDVGF